jgi:branched-chain amino acid transport system substrate-binding protein
MNQCLQRNFQIRQKNLQTMRKVKAMLLMNKINYHYKNVYTKIFAILGMLLCFGSTLNTEPIFAGGFKIGIVTSLTGPLAEYGRKQLNGYKMWAEQVNSDGGILNKKIELMIYDDGGQPEVGVMVAEKLAFRYDVNVIFGPFSSAVFYPLSSVVERSRIPMLSVGPVRSSIWQRDYKYIFMVFSPFEEFFIASINFAIEHKLKTVGLLVNDTPANKIDVRNGLIMAKEKGLK